MKYVFFDNMGNPVGDYGFDGEPHIRRDFRVGYKGTMYMRPHYSEKPFSDQKPVVLYSTPEPFHTEVIDYPRFSDLWTYCCRSTRHKFKPDSPEQFERAFQMYYGCKVTITEVIVSIRASGHFQHIFRLHFHEAPRDQVIYDEFLKQRHSPEYCLFENSVATTHKELSQRQRELQHQISLEKKLMAIQRELDALNTKLSSEEQAYTLKEVEYDWKMKNQQFKYPLLVDELNSII